MHTMRTAVLKAAAALALTLALLGTITMPASAQYLCVNEPILRAVDSNGDGIASAGEIRALAPDNADLQAAADRLQSQGYAGLQYTGCDGDSAGGGNTGGGNTGGGNTGGGTTGSGNTGSGNTGGGNTTSGNASSGTPGDGTTGAGSGSRQGTGSATGDGTANGTQGGGEFAIAGDGTGANGVQNLEAGVAVTSLPPVGTGTMAAPVAQTLASSMGVLSVLAVIGFALIRRRGVAIDA